MKRLRVPSAQHLARNWYSSPDRISKALVDMAENPPFFNYDSLHDAFRDLLQFQTPEEQVTNGIIEKEKRPKVRSILLEAVPLLCGHFSDIHPDFVHQVSGRYYSIGRNLRIPFNPGYVYGVGGQLYFSWLSFWKSNPLSGEQLELFVTLVEEMLLQDPDMESARFEILDFSSKKTGEHRRLEVIDTREIGRLSQSRKLEMLDTFAEGFEKAEIELARLRASRQSVRPEAPDRDSRQTGFWPDADRPES